MPVYLDWLTDQPSSQQKADLCKLLPEAPSAWGTPKSVDDYIANKPAMVALGVFNGRNVALCELKESDQGLLIERILVRKATRSRTVATQLIQRLCQWASTEQKTLLIRDEDERLNSLIAIGFQKQGHLWVRRN